MATAHADSKPMLLVVDDEPAVSTTLMWVFRQSGYNAAVARSRAEALCLCAAAVPDLALIEVDLPDATGVETARQLHRLAPACRIFFMSGDPEAANSVRQARAAGFDYELLPKPIPVPELLLKLKEALAQPV